MGDNRVRNGLSQDWLSLSRQAGCSPKPASVKEDCNARPASSAVLPIGNMLRRRGCAGLENVECIDAARFVIGGNKDRVSAAMDRSDNHQIVRQMETFNAE